MGITSVKYCFICLFLSVAGFVSMPVSAAISARDASNVSNETLDWMKKVANWQLTQSSWDKSVSWERGALHAGMIACYEATKDEKYLDSSRAWAEKFNWEPASGSFHADNVACGQSYVELYLLDSPDPARYEAYKSINDYYVDDPARFSCDVSSGSSTWWWCDALFMAPPGLVRLANVLEDNSYIDMMHTLWFDTQDCLYDTEEHLFFRDINYLPPYNYEGEKVFWSRGNGWVIAGTARTLQYLPLDDPNRGDYITLLQEMSESLAAIQLEDGYWHSDLLSPDRYSNPETSGTGFFTFGIAWGVNNGFLDETLYWDNVQAGWDALRAAVQPDGLLGWVQPVGADPRTTNEYNTDVFGVGAYLLAGSEVYKYELANSPGTIEIFESYLTDIELAGKWSDGSVNGSGSQIALGDYADNCMELSYDNSQWPYRSEVEIQFSEPKDLTVDDAYYLSILVKGSLDNDADKMYVQVVDENSNSAVSILTDTSVIQSQIWSELAVPLSDFAGVDISRIASFKIAVGSMDAIDPAGQGMIQIDNIRCVSRQCYPALTNDIIADCNINLLDVAEIASKWMLDYGDSIEPIDPGSANLIAHWALDGDFTDSTGSGYDCEPGDEVVFASGHINQAALFNGSDYVSYLLCDNSAELNFENGLTISAWIKSDGLDDSWASVITKGLRAWRLIRNNGSSAISFHFNAADSGEYQANGTVEVLDNQWHHLMAVYNGEEVRLYVDGELDGWGSAGSVNTSTDPVYIGSRYGNTHNRNWSGSIDDVRLYNIALNENNLLYLSENPGYIVIPEPDPADIELDGVIDQGDFETIVEQWLNQSKWP